MPALVSPGFTPVAGPVIRPEELLVPLPPAEAYAADVARLGGRAPLGPVDDAWLALTHTLARAATIPAVHRGSVCLAGARTARAVLPDEGPEPLRAAVLAAADGLAGLAGRLAGWRLEDLGAPDIAEAVSALQVVVAQQEQAGAFVLAFSTLAAFRRALGPVLGPRERGLLLAQQGRTARQLGAIATAARLYRASARCGRSAGFDDVYGRALLGRGVLANMRGNYPESRKFFRRALRIGVRAGIAELRHAGHHGLLVAACAAHDIEDALAHGWAAFRGTTEGASDERAEVLVNLGEVGRQAGEYRAALGACLSALELTDLARIRLPALGTAARAAAMLGEGRLLTFLARDVERTVARSGQPYENAHAFVELAEAYAVARDPQALDYAARATAMAGAGSFFEVTARADAVRDAMRESPSGTPDCAHAKAGDAHARRLDHAPAAHHDAPPASGLSARAQSVIRYLETLPAAGRYVARVTC